MGQDVTLFPVYITKENRATNYTMLIFKMLYDYDVDLFRELIISLTNEEIGSKIGVSLRQQIKAKTSVPDGLIFQESIAGTIETKVGDNFDCNQIQEHIKGLKDIKANFKFLILLGNLKEDKLDISKICPDLKEEEDILIIIQTFENILNTLNEILLKNQYSIPEHLQKAIKEYEIFLDLEKLLPTWKTLLDIVNCGRSINVVENHKIYACPNSGGPYSHRRAKYFGAYNDKGVKLIAEIEAVVEFDGEESPTIIWNNSTRKKNDLVEDAKTRFNLSSGGNPKNSKVFLLKDTEKVNFKKDTSGGMFGSKFYVFIKNKAIDKVSELKEVIDNKNWSDVIKIVDGQSSIL